MNKKLIVIDSGNILHRAIFSRIYQEKAELKKIVNELYPKIEFKTLSIESKEYNTALRILQNKIDNREFFMMKPTNNYLSMILGYLRILEVTLNDTIIIAEDYGSWRKKVDLVYKRQRKEFRESFKNNEWWSEQYSLFNKFIKKLDMSLPFYFIKIFDMEADDIASMCVRYMNNYDEKIIISTDQDWQMLCHIDKVKLFSPTKKKFIEVKNPLKILLDKIHGDISDNLKTVPANEAEFEKRKCIVNLLELPNHIENTIKTELEKLSSKNLLLNKVPCSKNMKERIKKLYKI